MKSSSCGTAPREWNPLKRTKPSDKRGGAVLFLEMFGHYSLTSEGTHRGGRSKTDAITHRLHRHLSLRPAHGLDRRHCQTSQDVDALCRRPNLPWWMAAMIPPRLWIQRSRLCGLCGTGSNRWIQHVDADSSLSCFIAMRSAVSSGHRAGPASKYYARRISRSEIRQLRAFSNRTLRHRRQIHRPRHQTLRNILVVQCVLCRRLPWWMAAISHHVSGYSARLCGLCRTGSHGWI